MSKNKYETHVLPCLDKIKDWAGAGATAKEIADKLHIAYSTFRKYLDDGENGDERYSALSAAFTRACAKPDGEVEAALFKLATGYTVSLAKVFKVKRVEYDPDTGRRTGEREELVVVHEETHVPANAQAQMFWLANRRPDRWQYKPEKRDEEDKGGGVIMLSPVLEGLDDGLARTSGGAAGDRTAGRNEWSGLCEGGAEQTPPEGKEACG